MLSPTSPIRRRKVEVEITPRYHAFLDAGFPLEDYQAQTLQCRNELDRTNWMELRDLCREAIVAEKAYYAENELPDPVAGWGSGLITAPGIRTTANTFIRPTVAETLVILAALSAWAMAAQANWWTLKDAARDAPTREALHAIDVNEGWP